MSYLHLIDLLSPPFVLCLGLQYHTICVLRKDDSTDSVEENEAADDSGDSGFIPSAAPPGYVAQICTAGTCGNVAAWQCPYNRCGDHCKDYYYPRHSRSYQGWLRSQKRKERANRTRGVLSRDNRTTYIRELIIHQHYRLRRFRP